MRFQPRLHPATLVRRYRRFLADVTLEDGQPTTVHCPNTGAMLGCDRPGSRVWLQRFVNPKRKYPLGWELVEVGTGIRVGINTGRSNALVAEALTAGQIPELAGYDRHRREVTVGHGRLDFALDGPGRRSCLVEVKNVTAAVEDGQALFPDAVSARASRHMRGLSEAARSGSRAVLLFCIQRDDVEVVRPARSIDPDYADAVRTAIDHGVEVLAYRWRMSPAAAVIDRRVAFEAA